MPLRDDDLTLSARAAPPQVAKGEYALGQQTAIILGKSDQSWAMVSRHEQTHLELNLMTTFGLLLRVLASDEYAKDHDNDLMPQFIALCRVTHEVVATTTGVWWTTSADEGSLDEYPDYVRYLDMGREITRGLPPGSYSAITAIFCAGLVAMQAPLGQYLGQGPLSAASIPREASPDNRLAVLHRASLPLDQLDVDAPRSWLSGRVTETDTSVDDHQRRWGRVAGAYYRAFQGVLEDSGLDCQPYDEVDATVVRWAREVVSPRAIGLPHYVVRAATGPEDPYWAVAASDREQVLMHCGRRLIACKTSALPDAPTADQPVALSHLLGGPRNEKSALVVVRPLATLLRQYAIDDETRAHLVAAAIGGVVTAVRVEVYVAGELTTVLATLDYPADFSRISGLRSRYGLIASVAMSCMEVLPWALTVIPILGTSAYTTVLFDLPRRELVQALEHTGHRVTRYALRMTSPGGAPVYALMLHLPDTEIFVNRPFLVVGSEHTVRGLDLVLGHASGINSQAVEGLGAEPVKCRGTLTRLRNEEPTFDALGVLDIRQSVGS